MSTDAAAAPQQSAAAQTGESSLLDQIIDTGIRPLDDYERTQAKPLVEEFVKTLMTPGVQASKYADKTIQAAIAEIDAKLSAQLNQILHHEAFQKLESSWRGLHYLVQNAETGTSLKIRVLNASKKDLLKDLERASEFDQSALFKAIYTEEYDQFGGSPYGTLIGDYEFGRGAQDMALLERLAEIAAAAHAPFVGAANAGMFGLESFSDIGAPRDLAKIFETPEYTKWRSFRESEDSRYVGLTVPHTLMRVPYGNGESETQVDAFDFQEDIDGRDHSKYLWGNAAWAFAGNLARSFADCGWLATIRGVEGGGKVEGLPVHTFKTDEGDVAAKCPTEVAISDRREKELADLGFMPLLHCKDTDYAAFFSAQSCQKAIKYDRDAANANAALSTALQYIYVTSRFAHYLKCMARDKIGSFMERDECEAWLNRWINNYTLADPSMVGPKGKAERPLKEAQVKVEEIPGKPGHYSARAYMRPHFQLEALSANLSLVADLPGGGK